MSDEDAPEVTREGLFEEIVGKAKEATGELLGNEHLVEEGKRQQEEAEAEPGPVTPPEE